MKIDEIQDPDYEAVTISNLGFVDPYGNEGLVILTSSDKKEFHMRAFSGEVAKHISSFDDTDGEPAPSIYRMIEEICDQSELTLVKVKIYESGDVLRANLYFTGKTDLVLRNHRASDAMALGAYYNVPILIRKKLLKERMEA